MTAIFDLADRYVAEWAALDPCGATSAGVDGHEHELTDYSPAGVAARADLARRTRRELAAIEPSNELDRIARAAIDEHLELALDLVDAGEWRRDLNVLDSPMQHVRYAFDLMEREGDEAWDAVLARTRVVPRSLTGARESLADGMVHGTVAARRQALGCAEQAAAWGGTGARPSYFHRLADEHDATAAADPTRSAALRAAADDAAAAYAELAEWLRTEYAPRAAPVDPVGSERYGRFARVFTGARLDLPEVYEWGWEELHRIDDESRAVADRILPGAPLPEVYEHLEHDDDRAVVGADALVAYLQDLMDRTVAELDGRHFDIPAPLRRVEAMIAPPGGAAAMYYTPPSEDFRRPGRTWYPTLDKERFPLWNEVTTCYHEGVPGHHLQVGHCVWLADRLSRFQRVLGFNSGHGEGWALYAERLMGELGFLEDPAYELGMLRAQAFRAMRVIVDIGLHLEREIPRGAWTHEGARWTPELALEFAIEVSGLGADFLVSEVDRYLGLPGQAISYKVGERVWLDGRAAARARAGAAFDLKAWHMAALDLGPMGLDQFAAELDRL